jgi:DNA polymerase
LSDLLLKPEVAAARGVAQIPTDILGIDFETKSLCDLKKHGLDRYKNDPSTRPTCMAFAFNDEPPELWLPGQPLPERVRRHVELGGRVRAWNAQFEFAIWNTICAPLYGWPELKLEQIRCTQAKSFAQSLPGKLENAAPAVGVSERKDTHGHRIMMQLCRPKKTWAPDETGYAEATTNAFMGVIGYEIVGDLVVLWHTDPIKWATLYAYCKQDVVTERAIDNRLMPLSDFEQAVYVLDQRINLRGVPIDMDAVRGAQNIVESEKKRLDKQMYQLTAGFVRTCNSSKKLTEWLRENGIVTAGVAKADIAGIMQREKVCPCCEGEGVIEDPFASEEEDAEFDCPDCLGSGTVRNQIPAHVEEVLKVRQAASKSSVSKLQKIVNWVGPDGRVRYTHQYHAAGTGRFGGRGPQFQNLKRPEKWIKDSAVQDQALTAMAKGANAQLIDMMFGPPTDVIANCIRGFIKAPPGREFVAPDFSNIEGRVTAWLSNEQWKVQAFREADAGTGPGIYELTYSRAFDVPVADVDDYMRQIGKVMELAFGFAGGVGAGQSMARIYGVKISDTQMDANKNAWRDMHSNVVKMWYAMERAAHNAVLLGGKHSAQIDGGPKVDFIVNGSFLWMRLPSGRCICYPYPKILPVETPWGELKDQLTFMQWLGGDPKAAKRALKDHPDNDGRFVRVSAHAGLIFQNAVQAIARDKLVCAMLTLDQHGYEIVMHAHDEATNEIDASCPVDTQSRIEELMCESSGWDAGLPVVSAAWRKQRYGKHEAVKAKAAPAANDELALLFA